MKKTHQRSRKEQEKHKLIFTSQQTSSLCLLTSALSIVDWRTNNSTNKNNLRSGCSMYWTLPPGDSTQQQHIDDDLQRCPRCWVSINYLSFIFCLSFLVSLNRFLSSVSVFLYCSSGLVSVLSCCLILLYFGNRSSLYISCSFTSHLCLPAFWMPSLLPVSLPISLECIHSLPLVWSLVYLLFFKCFSFCSLSFVPRACFSVSDSLLKTFWLYLSHKFSIALIYI